MSPLKYLARSERKRSDSDRDSSSESSLATTLPRRFLQSALSSTFPLSSSAKQHSSPAAKYELGGVIGSGASGTVHIATDVMTGVQWACKVITEDLGVSTSLEEVELMRQLSDHPNIVSYREHFFYGGRLHIIMEYVKGANLGDAITYRGSFAEEDAREVFRQLHA